MEGPSYVNPAYVNSIHDVSFNIDMTAAEKDTSTMNEEEYREWLQQIFKPIFNNYSDKIPNEQLLRIFQFHSFGLPEKKLMDFLLKMDTNLDGFVAWEEFYQAMIRKRSVDLRQHQRIILASILAANPEIKKKERLKSVDVVDKKGADDEYIPDSYLEAYNCRPPPIFIPISCLTQIIIFIIYSVEINQKNEPWNQVTWTGGLPYWSPLIFDPAYRFQIWRYFTYMFIHQGIHHIVFNICLQIILGIPLEIVNKFWRVGPVFIAGVILGSLASGTIDRYTAVVGASGGCYALIGAHYAIVVMNWEEMQYEWLNCRQNPFGFIASGIVRLIVLTIVVGLDFGVALYQRYGLPNEVKTSFAAHLGGLLAGLLVGIPVLKNLDKKPWEIIVFWISLAIFICLIIFGVFWNIFYPDYPKPKT